MTEKTISSVTRVLLVRGIDLFVKKISKAAYEFAFQSIPIRRLES